MKAIGTAQRNRNSSSIVKLYKAWENQAFDYFYFIDFNETPSSFNFPKLKYFHKTYEGEYNCPFNMNVGCRLAIKDGVEYLQIIGDDAYPAHKDYFNVCMDLMDEYDIIMPKLVRSNQVVPEFNNIDDKRYIDFIKAAPASWQKYYNEGCIFMKTKVIDYLQGYDENYVGWGYEDKDFIERAIQAGFKVKKLDPPYHLVHSFHERPGPHSKKSIINNQLFSMTKKKKLPIQRMSVDWGLFDSPRVDYKLRNQLENRIKYE